MGAFLRDLWRKLEQDDVLFLAGGVAFNILLAGVPFFLLLAAALGYALGQSADAASSTVQAVLERLLPAQVAAPGESLLDPVLVDVVRTRALAGVGGAIGFVWFSTRLFGSLRSVMAVVFERRGDRNFLRGKLWDVHLTVSSAVLVAVWVTVNTFLVVSTGRLGAALAQVGVLADVVNGVEYAIARILSVAVIIAIFFSLYRWLPARRTPWTVALVGGVVAASLFEFARWIFAMVMHAFPPTSLYSGTLGALVVVMFWTYYAALIFVLGAEIAHATERYVASAAPQPSTR